MGKYDDIIDLPHHVSGRHPQMSPLDRAAQFSPFAALTGHRAMIAETERLTRERAELNEDRREEIALQLKMLREREEEKPEAVVTFFLPDEKKTGGSYQTVTGRIKKVDEYGKRIVMESGMTIPAEDIYEIVGKEFGILSDSGIWYDDSADL